MEDGVDGHEDGAVFVVPAREPRPDEYHGDAARETDEDEPFAEGGAVGEEGPGEGELEGEGRALVL